MLLLAWPLVFWVDRFFGLLILLLALFCLFPPLVVPFCIPFVYFMEPCSLLFNILLLLLIKKKRNKIVNNKLQDLLF